MRRRDLLSPEDERELEALDRALAGESVNADLRELEQIVLDVRATAPRMSPAFAARLEQAVGDGFPAPAGQAPPRRGRARRWMLIPAAGTVAAALVALVVVLGPGGEDRQAATSIAEAPAPKPSTSYREDAPAPAAGAVADSAAGESKRAPRPPEAGRSVTQRSPSAASPPATATAVSPGAAAVVPTNRVERKVERTALLVLETPDGSFQSTTDAIIRTVDRFDGIVANSSIGSSDRSGGEATFNLRIPTAKLDAALAALSKLGHVTERNQDLQDITGSFISVQERLSDARAERRGLLRALGNATTQRQIDSLRARLRNVRATIGRLNGDLASLRRRADLSSVTVTLRGGGDSGGAAAHGDHWGPGDAARDAVRVLEVIAGVALVALAVAVPLALLGGVISFGARLGRRRGRERALDPA